MRTIEGAKFKVGQKVRHVIFDEEVEIISIDVRQHGFDDYWVKSVKDGYTDLWAEECDLEEI